MATLIGNLVIVLVITVVANKMFGSSDVINQKARDTLHTIDASLSEKQKTKNKKQNPEDFCTAKDYMQAASIITHNGSNIARQELGISNKQALRLRYKMMRQIN
tara:strand:- start:18132 stop:18443 length:312 start_codon:yes stop_codon:yes gene_type:complete